MKTQPEDDTYLRQTHRPLVCLAFLLPWVVLYELGTLAFSSSPSGLDQERVVAYLLLERFFRLFGVTALYLPGLALIAVFVAWHVATGEPWRLRWPTLLGMAVESLVLALPMLMFNELLAASAAEDSRFADWGEKLVLSIGAGVYEELVFRLIAITLLSTLFVDLFKLRQGVALVLMVIFSSLIFAAHHYPPLGRDAFDTTTFLFRSVAGAYLATIFVLRGFGIAVGSHVMYDIMVVTWSEFSS